jgi:TPP-dependent pyruvate/acetoin dehydrogenase alpha subunit
MRGAPMELELTNVILDGGHTYPRDFLLNMVERMVLCRQFEERVKLLFLEGTMPGTIHQSQGQEASAVGVCTALNADDFMTSTHRPHSHALAKGLTPEEMMLELSGKVGGCCKGKGGSMHMGNMDKGMVPAIAIVGGGIPLASGIGLSFKMRKRSQVVACFFGEGASNEGAFHEGVNLASIWSLPVIFICENNLYGASTAISKTTRVPRISQRAESYGIRGETVDGNNVIKVYEATRRAADECRRGEGPVLLEMLTYRRVGHSRRDPAHYQDKTEQAFWFERDPIALLQHDLLSGGYVTEENLKAIDARVQQSIEDAITVARKSPLPTVGDLTTDVFATELP